MKVGQEASVSDLAVLNIEQIVASPFHTIARWWDGFEFTSVRALNRVPDPNLRAFGEDVVNCDVQIRKPGKVSSHTLLHAITADDSSVDGKLFREELVYYRQAALIKSLVDPAAYKSLVALFRGIPCARRLLTATCRSRQDGRPEHSDRRATRSQRSSSTTRDQFDARALPPNDSRFCCGACRIRRGPVESKIPRGG